MASIRFGLLGALRLTCEDREIRLGGGRQRAVLALLLLRHGRTVSVDELAETVWDGSPPPTARTQISICVAQLRKLFREAGVDGEVIATSHPGYRLDTEGHGLDLVDFLSLTGHASALAGSGRSAEAADAYRLALALWRGPALDGLTGYALEQEACWLEEQRLTALDGHAELRLALGRHQELTAELAALVREHPLRERTRHSLMLAQYRSGRRADALETFRVGHQLSIDELGLEPGTALRELHHAVLCEDPAIAAPPTVPEPVAPVAPVAPAVPVAHVTAEESAGQPETSPADSPGEASAPVDRGPALPAPPLAPSDLPPNIPSFTGRTAEIEVLDALLDGRPDGEPPRVALVTGVAGIGKTALAVHWSHRAAASFPDGCLHVDLGSAPAAPGEVLGRLLRSLGAPGERLPDDEASRISLYRRLLRGRRVLVVLDDASSFAQVAPLLPANGGCCVVVTSRESMEELVLRHGAVRVPLGVLDRADSTALLDRIVTGGRTAASRAQTARLAELCDGLPLALCIAAARLATRPHWTVRRLADRLADEHRRLDELSLGGSRVRASFELSHGCLSPRLASVYRRLSLLDVPDVPAWAVAALLDCPVETAEQYLDELTDAHLLEVSGPDATGQYRYRFQSLLRLYARERAQEDPDRPAAEAARDRALHSWLTVAEAAHRREYGGDHSVVHGPAPRPHVDRDLLDDLLARPLDWFDSERHCLVAAVTQSARLGLAALAWDLAASTVGFCEIRSNTDDWRRLCEEGLAASRAAGDRQGEGVMLGELGAALLYRGESEASVRLLEEADGVLRAGGEVYGAALNACKLAVVVRQRGDAGAARALLDGALPALRAAGDLSAQAHALNNLAQIALDAGDLEEAVRLGREAVALARGLGATRGAAQAFHRLGRALLAAGRLPEAEEALTEAAGIVRAKRDRLGMAYVLLGLAEARLRAGRADRADEDLTAALALAEETGSTVLMGRLHLLRVELEEARAPGAVLPQEV
ncbi:AfsR/SARP family transcriptional regulator [Streptomyces nymphaeiformis]|uniref:DNA-binding SARP family transcriptional activator n=1 Tax=Streptomyces nymphaeiformis TaxID=2663842 RepID=A0A7W7X8J0_9ACTN|nr:BTAD domain-containing putative transcriptional regulator [Streptomyces nymphaeiformis]MBB4979399.1 DNA-binding SARP family transcriptional activator [Streptomyces nymphaeiformis]